MIPGSVGRSPPTPSTNPHPTPRGPLVCLCHWIWKKAEKWKGRVLSWAEHGHIWKGWVINLSALSLALFILAEPRWRRGWTSWARGSASLGSGTSSRRWGTEANTPPPLWYASGWRQERATGKREGLPLCWWPRLPRSVLCLRALP